MGGEEYRMGSVIERKAAHAYSTFHGETILRRVRKIVHRESPGFPGQKESSDAAGQKPADRAGPGGTSGKRLGFRPVAARGIR